MSLPGASMTCDLDAEVELASEKEGIPADRQTCQLCDYPRHIFIILWRCIGNGSAHFNFNPHALRGGQQ